MYVSNIGINIIYAPIQFQKSFQLKHEPVKFISFFPQDLSLKCQLCRVASFPRFDLNKVYNIFASSSGIFMFD